MSPQEELASIEAQVAALEERKRSLYEASLKAPQEEKLCDDHLAEMLSESWPRFVYPVSLHGITYSGNVLGNAISRTKPGAWVKVRPCDEEHKGKTFLGIFLGAIALSVGCSFDPKSGILEIRQGMHNPAMWVPAINKIVFGAGSWWGEIKDPDELRQISDGDIAAVPYVRVLKALAGDGAPPQMRGSEGS